jgi:hypothetical protein
MKGWWKAGVLYLLLAYAVALAVAGVWVWWEATHIGS